MKEDKARSILRLVAVFTVFGGAILTMVMFLAVLGVTSMIHNAPGNVPQRAEMLAGMGLYVVLAPASFVLGGVALYLLSPKLAQHIAETDGPSAQSTSTKR